MIPTSCNRLRLGGTVSGSAITGGVSIQNDRLFTTSFAGLLGHPGRRGGDVTVPFLDGQLRRPSKRSLLRTVTLTVEVMDRDASGLIPTTRGQQWEANMDLLLELIDGNGETVILERDMADGSTRFLECEAKQPWAFSEGVKLSNHVSYLAAIQLDCVHPYWQSEALNSKAIGATFTPPGNATLFNQTISFATSGNWVHTNSGDSMIVSAGSFPVLVDSGKRLVTVGGVDASNRVTLNSPSWFRFASATSHTFSGSATGTMSYRDQWI